MYGWSFAARSVEEVERLLRALQKHRYLQSVDHRLHWSVDRALADADPAFLVAVRHFDQIVATAGRTELDLGSRDPRLWRSVELDELMVAFNTFWLPGMSSKVAQQKLAAVLRQINLPRPIYAPFCAAADDPPHPEVVMLDWTFLSVDELDGDRHGGALRALEASEPPSDPSEPIYVEGPALGELELSSAARGGVLPDDFFLWADGPYSYCDYVFRGVAKAARLVDPPVGYRDIDRA